MPKMVCIANFCTGRDKSSIRLLTSFLLIMVLSNLQISDAVARSKSRTPSNSPQAINSKLGDGLYLVLAQSKRKKLLAPRSSNQIVLLNDFRFLQPKEREEPVYMLLQKEPFIPLRLEGRPLEDKEEGSNKPRLLLQLEESQIEPLKAFTQTNIGKTIAIVIGGDIVTAHKVRTAIDGGKLQITRCTKYGCYTLYSRLLKDRH